MANEQFRAEAGKVYRNAETGQTVSYNQAQLDSNPALGSLSNQFSEYSPSAGNATTGNPGAANQTLANMTEGLIDPMDLPDVRSGGKFTAAKAMLEEQANATFDPQILRTQQTGRSQVSSASGISGQRQGQNLSTAELSYINSTSDQVDAQIKSLEQQKAAFVSDGLFDLANSLSEQQIQLMNAKNNLILQKASLGLQLRQQTQAEQEFESTFGLTKEQFEESKTQFQNQLSLDVANLTGVYEGDPTFAARQADISNALQEAGLTGYYNGQETLQSVTQKAQLALQERGIEINEKQLEETIRSNKVQENLARARMAQGEAAPADTPASFVNDSVARLKELRDSGQLNDANYKAELMAMAPILGYDADSYGQLDSLISKAMEGNIAAQDALTAAAQQEMGSDFTVSEPSYTGSAGAGAAVRNFIARGGVLPELTSAWTEVGSQGYNFFSGLLGGKPLSREDIRDIKQSIGGSVSNNQ